MGKRSLSTPRSIIRDAVRQVWLRSRERAAAIKAESNTCEACNVKGHKSKKHPEENVIIEVHHLDGCHIERIVDMFFESGLLCDPSRLQVLCKECHKKITEDT